MGARISCSRGQATRVKDVWRNVPPVSEDQAVASSAPKHLELAIEARQGVIDDPPDRAQRMPGGDPLFEIDIAEPIRSPRLHRAYLPPPLIRSG